MTPYTIFYTIGGGDDLPAEENSAENSDFDEEDAGGAPLNGSVNLGPGANVVDVVIVPIPEAIHEFPETVSITINDHGNYDPSPLASRAEGLIYDQEDIADNETLFVGFSIPQPRRAKSAAGECDCFRQVECEKGHADSLYQHHRGVQFPTDQFPRAQGPGDTWHGPGCVQSSSDGGDREPGNGR